MFSLSASVLLVFGLLAAATSGQDVPSTNLRGGLTDRMLLDGDFSRMLKPQGEKKGRGHVNGQGPKNKKLESGEEAEAGEEVVEAEEVVDASDGADDDECEAKMKSCMDACKDMEKEEKLGCIKDCTTVLKEDGCPEKAAGNKKAKTKKNTAKKNMAKKNTAKKNMAKKGRKKGNGGDESGEDEGKEGEYEGVRMLEPEGEKTGRGGHGRGPKNKKLESEEEVADEGDEGEDGDEDEGEGEDEGEAGEGGDEGEAGEGGDEGEGGEAGDEGEDGEETKGKAGDNGCGCWRKCKNNEDKKGCLKVCNSECTAEGPDKKKRVRRKKAVVQNPCRGCRNACKAGKVDCATCADICGKKGERKKAERPHPETSNKPDGRPSYPETSNKPHEESDEP